MPPEPTRLERMAALVAEVDVTWAEALGSGLVLAPAVRARIHDIRDEAQRLLLEEATDAQAP